MARRRFRLSPEHWGLMGGGALLLALLVLGIGGARNWWGRQLQLSFRTYSAAGLKPGMPVKISGYPVGHVQRMRLLNDAQVQVILTISANRQAMLGRNSRASLAQDSLLSQNYISISPDLSGLADRDAVGNGDTLIYEAGQDIPTLIKELAASRIPLQQMITRSASLVDKRLPQSLTQLDRTLLSGQHLADTLQHELVGSSGALMGRVDNATNNLDQTLGSLKSTLLEVESLARSSNSLLQGIRRSWLIQLLEPAGSPPLNWTPQSPDPAAKPGTKCPGALRCAD